MELPELNGYLKKQSIWYLCLEIEYQVSAMKYGIKLMALLKKDFRTELVYTDKYLKAKIKSYQNVIKTDC